MVATATREIPITTNQARAAIRQLPPLARGLPDLLGRITADLHSLDPKSLRTVVAEAGAVAPSDTLTFLACLTEAADRLGRTDLSEAARWLFAHPPPTGRRVIGHGDLHPFNLLVDGERWTLLDWSTALVTDPAYDLAFTTLMLSHPPLAAPRRYVRSSAWPGPPSLVGSSPPTERPVAMSPTLRRWTGTRACTPYEFSWSSMAGDGTRPGSTTPPTHGQP